MLEAPERVLSTLNKDGSRRWLRPRLARGRFQRRRLLVAWLLILAYTLMPILRMGGKPLMLFDLDLRRFTLFGATFQATDTLLLMLLMVSILLSIFLLTALLGRVWCGWGCPQTVYMEYLFRPLERLIEGDHLSQHQLDQAGGGPRRLLKHALFLVISALLANTFLAYWVGWERLLDWMSGPPGEHWGGFVVMAVTTALTFVDFAWFREQTCIVACPYGRFQSVLLDRHSLIVAYDQRRGEPRTKLRRADEWTSGARQSDCVDCHHCVVVCPTGIDIREGLQMECVHCTQCIDACDEVMDKVGRPRGLIRYGSQSEMATGRRRLLRPRVVLYPLALGLVLGLLVWNLTHRVDTELTILRGLGMPYQVLPGGLISDPVRIRIANKAERSRRYWVALTGPEEARLVAPVNPVTVGPGALEMTYVYVSLPAGAFDDGRARGTLIVTDSLAFHRELSLTLFGPDDDDGEHDGHDKDPGHGKDGQDHD